MKKTFTLLTLLLVFLFNEALISQNILTDTTIFNDCYYYPFDNGDTIQGLEVSGSVTLNSDSSLVRIIYIDNNNDEWMLLESYPIITNEQQLYYYRCCEETSFFNNNITGHLKFEVNDASFSIDTLFCIESKQSNSELLRVQHKYNVDKSKVENINQYNIENNLRWTADYNSFVGKFYNEKKQIVGDKYNLFGYDYYRSGIFETKFTNTEPINLTKTRLFDWRSRHDANNQDSYYYDGDDITKTGWLTKINEQDGCGACWAFSTTAAVEAVSNLYFNIPNLDLDLSEQEIISCSNGFVSCKEGGYVSKAYEFIRDDGVKNDLCFKYENSNAGNTPCESDLNCNIPEYKLFITDFFEVDDSNIDNVISTLINNGPLQINGTYDESNHGESLIGYYYSESDAEIIWIVENSFGDNWGTNGVGYLRRNYFELVPKATTNPIIVNYTDNNTTVEKQWFDKDQDGIYWWGLGDKPEDCPGSPYLRDCNDNNPGLGGYDQNFNCQCIMTYSFESETIKAGSYIIYSEETFKDHDIIIEENAVLTISDVLHMTDSARIIVQRGGKLIVNGGRITNLCNNRWKGIEVWGTSNTSQENSSEQGVVELNNAIIENAIVGIETIKRTNPHYQTQAVYRDFSGGIIISENSKFINCETSIYMWPYPYGEITSNFVRNRNLSSISNTSFLLDEEFFTVSDFEKFQCMIKLDGVSSITLNNIDLINDQVFEKDIEKSGYGIYATNSTFQLIATNYENIISGFTYGIYSIESVAKDSYTLITQNNFENNLTGIYMSCPLNYSNPFVIYNNQITTPSIRKIINSPCIYVDETSSFEIEENKLFGDVSIIPGELNKNSQIISIGIIINNCGANTNTIYNNVVKGFDHGIQSQNSNRDMLGTTGLLIKCNDFTECFYDELILGKQPIHETYGINIYQGTDNDDPTAPAGNTFYWNELTSNNDILNNTNSLTYFYHAIDNGFNVKPSSYSNDLINTATNFENPQEYTKMGSCPPPIAGLKNTISTSVYNRLIAYDLEIDSLETVLSDLIDNGNTIYLNNNVISSLPNETMSIREQLLSASPYLSDTVLKSTAIREDVIPNSILTEILVQNPHSVKNNNILNYLSQRDTLLDQNQYNHIMQGKDYIGTKETIESKYSNLLNLREKAFKNYIIDLYKKDTTLTSNDSLVNIFLKEKNLKHKYNLIDLYLNEKDTISAINIYNQINTNSDLTNSEFNFWLEYNSYLVYRIYNIRNGYHIGSIDSSQTSYLYSLYYNTNSELNTVLKNILIIGDTLSYKEPYLTIDSTLKQNKVLYRSINSKNENEIFDIYPNPAKEYFVLDINNLSYLPQNKSEINIYTIDGKYLKTFNLNSEIGYNIIETSNLKTGLYIISLIIDNQKVGSKKLLITK